jgi:hypothetical protein
MVFPWNKKEYNDAIKWSKASEARILAPVNCIPAWFDICGYGEILAKCNWDLSKIMQNPPPIRTLKYDLTKLKQNGLIDTRRHARSAVWFLLKK